MSMSGSHVPGPRFSLASRARSFRYAFAGLGFMLRSQHNAWLHLIATVLALGLGAALRVGPDDWRWLITAILMVWSAEAFNTAVEYVCDVVSPGYSEAVKRAKDIAAGAVLISSAGALAIGLITFWPHAAPFLKLA
jgi:diacylglycerol kinase (ATP)